MELELSGWTSGPGTERLDDIDISSIYLPSLRHLTVWSESRDDLNQIIKLVEHSSCPLTSITLHCSNFLEVTVKRLLSLLRMSLREVALGGSYHIRHALLDCFFSSSPSSKQSDFYLPHVEELEITTMVMVDLRPYDRVLGAER